jgi:predicted nucleic acid-binding protein
LSHLLDANALIALGWPTHEHHPRMVNWFAQHARAGWASTAITQSAFVRIVSQPAFSGRAIAVGEVAELLLCNTAHPKHRLVPLDFGVGCVHGRHTWTPPNNRCVAADRRHPKRHEAADI